MATRVRQVEVSVVGERADITLSRPDRMNALSEQLLIELKAALNEIRSSDARVVVIQGSGERAFCAGADIDELWDSGQRARRWLEIGHEVFRQIETYDRPTIAVVQGLALGGGFELAMACSLLVGSTQARFGLPEPKLGLIPGLGGVERLTRQVGVHRANRILLTGEIIGAAEANALGLLSFPPVPPTDLEGFMSDLCETIASLSTRALGAVLEAQVYGLSASVDEALENELSLAVRAIASSEGREGMAAFREKRPAHFSPARSGGLPSPSHAQDPGSP
ncbi:MAG TPA: enoyl-CoA hydratase/isomerase family protein [Acidimicrobiia bacterium]|nr:enoyl-CoA hydratase/isomerase family protein [Acidimicrobiia bacterium]